MDNELKIEYSCPICNRSFNSNAAQKNHIRRDHQLLPKRWNKKRNLDGTYTCPICFKNYKSREGLRRHKMNPNGKFGCHPQNRNDPSSTAISVCTS